MQTLVCWKCKITRAYSDSQWLQDFFGLLGVTFSSDFLSSKSVFLSKHSWLESWLYFILFFYFFDLFYLGQHICILWASKDEGFISFFLPILVRLGQILWEWIEAIWPIKLALFWFYLSHMMSCSYFSEWLQCVCLNKSAILLLLLLYFLSF